MTVGPLGAISPAWPAGAIVKLPNSSAQSKATPAATGTPTLPGFKCSWSKRAGGWAMGMSSVIENVATTGMLPNASESRPAWTADRAEAPLRARRRR